jgi:programmed cell death 6-interacting protein
MLVYRDMDMPSLGNLNLSHNHGSSQNAGMPGYGVPSPQTHGGHQGMPAMPPPQRSGMQSPAEASIQSWAGGGESVQQPQPMPPPANPMGGVWEPSMGIRFGGPGGGPPGGAGAGQAQQQGPAGTWKPGSGIKFG